MRSEQRDDYRRIDEDEGVGNDDERWALDFAATESFATFLGAGQGIATLEQKACDNR